MVFWTYPVESGSERCEFFASCLVSRLHSSAILLLDTFHHFSGFTELCNIYIYITHWLTVNPGWRNHNFGGFEYLKEQARINIIVWYCLPLLTLLSFGLTVDSLATWRIQLVSTFFFPLDLVLFHARSQLRSISSRSRAGKLVFNTKRSGISIPWTNDHRMGFWVSSWGKSGYDWQKKTWSTHHHLDTGNHSSSLFWKGLRRYATPTRNLAFGLTLLDGLSATLDLPVLPPHVPENLGNPSCHNIHWKKPYIEKMLVGEA